MYQYQSFLIGELMKCSIYLKQIFMRKKFQDSDTQTICQKTLDKKIMFFRMNV